MSCDVSKGKIELACKDAVGGLKTIYLANYSDSYGFTVSSASASGHQLTDLGSLSEVFAYELKNSANTFQQDIQSSRDNGTTLFNQVLNFTLTKLSAEMEFQVKMMSLGRPQIFVKTNSGLVFLMGKEFGCEIAGNSQVQGTLDALNAYQLTATAQEKEPIFYLDASSIKALEALVSSNNVSG